MPDYTVTISSAADAAIDAYATENGIAKADVITQTAADQGEKMRQHLYNNWWSTLTLDEKQALYEA